MDHSTEGVTLYAAFVNDVLNMFEGKPADLEKLKDMASGLDLSKFDNKVPMHVYNEMCNYVLQEIGPANTRLLGKRIGATAFQGMVANNLIPEKATPQQVMDSLVTVAKVMIQDPKGRGWEILESHPKRMVMRRTQTFNGVMQIGLLLGLLEKSTAISPRVERINAVENGADYDDYGLTWL